MWNLLVSTQPTTLPTKDQTIITEMLELGQQYALMPGIPLKNGACIKMHSNFPEVVQTVVKLDTKMWDYKQNIAFTTASNDEANTVKKKEVEMKKISF